MKNVAIILAILSGLACMEEEDIPKHDAASPPLIVPKNDASADPSTSAISTTSTTTSTSTQTATYQILRHLPGTAVKLPGDASVYLVGSDGTLSKFASATALHTSGYSDSMVVTITAAEFSCYQVGSKQIKSGLPSPGTGLLRDGSLVREKTKSTVYAVSDGVAWSIISIEIFSASGYKEASVEFVSDGTLKSMVEGVGNCGTGLACLDKDYVTSCAADDLGGIIVDPDPTATVTSTATATATATATQTQSQTQTQTSSPTVTQTATATATVTPTVTQTTTQTQLPTNTQTVTSTVTPTKTQTQTSTQTTTSTQTKSLTQTVTDSDTDTDTETIVATQTPTSTSTSTVTSTAVPTKTQTQTATSVVTVTQTQSSTASATQTQTATPSATATQTQTQTSGTSNPAPTWVWQGDGPKICLNAVYFLPLSATRAVLRTWTGPYVTGTNAGPVTGKDGQNRFCWDFTGMQAGLYRLWADVPNSSCATADFCGDDGMGGDGAQYGTAPNTTSAERKWLYCESTGCDGYAVFNGSGWIAANQ